MDGLVSKDLNDKSANAIAVQRPEINPPSAGADVAMRRGANPSDPFIHFDQVTLRLRAHTILTHTDWHILRGKSWAVIGQNGAGKSTLVRALAGLVPVVAGWIHRHGLEAQPEAIGYAAFENEHRFVMRDRLRDEARAFSGRFRGGLRVGQLLRAWQAPAGKVAEVSALLALQHLTDRRVRHLSSGEIRRLFIARALLKSQKLVVLDEPFEGLDRHHRHHLTHLLESTIADGRQLVLVTHHLENIPAGVTEIMALKEGRVVLQGDRKTLLDTNGQQRLFEARPDLLTTPPPPPINRPSIDSAGDIVHFNNVTVRYGSQVVVRNLSWRVRAGENWALCGPNGAGKSTLLAMIAGDHPQAYANEIYLFGRRRGSGESIWEIKRHIGLVSSEFHRRYHRHVTVQDAVASGFYDSVGRYRRLNPPQREQITAWLERFELNHLRARPLATLSYGQQRLVLIARAMVKKPTLLILDEPCQGLDPVQRSRVITAINQIGRSQSAQIIYVSHHADQIPACITRHLELTLAGRPVVR
jgi:molybdate transport system ATP-binding protein